MKYLLVFLSVDMPLMNLLALLLSTENSHFFNLVVIFNVIVMITCSIFIYFFLKEDTM